MNSIHFNENSEAKIILFSDLQECAKLTADFLKSGNIALSGGSTFASLFKSWEKMNLDLKNSEFFPVDERVVPFDDPASNWGFAYNNFLSKCGHENDQANFPSSYDYYIKRLTKVFGPNTIPQFETIMLGVGDDGHTASLFPEGEYFDDLTSIILETVSPKKPKKRISLAPATILNCHKLITIISGSGKKEIFKRITQTDKSLPIVKILSKRKSSVIYLDRNLLD